MQPCNITVVGAGYVGLSLAVLLAPRHRVQLLDIDAAKVDLIRQGISPLADAEIRQRLPESPVHATTDAAHAYAGADTVIIATPTNYDSDNGYFFNFTCTHGIRVGQDYILSNPNQDYHAK